ncbi:hypothetical protein [Myroides injenensis]|uniref:hypothetical protein n=1 Tax=Myroides injenensis TaxID=1183151 RepID=UPI0002893E9D|nr:hypothetical protein [Myroides injenensis]
MNKIITYILLLIVSVNCTSLRSEKDSKVELNIEKILSIHRELAFIDLYEKSLDKIKKESGISTEDILFDLTGTELYHEYCMIIDFYSDDHPTYENVNYYNLIKKWGDKTYKPYGKVDDPKLIVHMTFRKAFDFYYSDDLDNYIDSLRTLFRAKYYKEGRLKNLECLEAQERIKAREREIEKEN